MRVVNYRDLPDEISQEGIPIIRGRDWKWRNQDRGESGVIIGWRTTTGKVPDSFGEYWVKVRWESKEEFFYRVGPRYYDLYYNDTISSTLDLLDKLEDNYEKTS